LEGKSFALVLINKLPFFFAYFWGYTLSELGTLFHDRNINPLGYGGGSTEDINLGYKMGELGSKLFHGTVSRFEVGDWILNNVGKADYESDRETQANLISLGAEKKKFRIYEYERNGLPTSGPLWDRKEEMISYTCNAGQTIYIQHYNSFYIGEDNYWNPKVIWNDGNEKMIFLRESELATYPDNESVCDNLISLGHQRGIFLNLDFPGLLSSLASLID